MSENIQRWQRKISSVRARSRSQAPREEEGSISFGCWSMGGVGWVGLVVRARRESTRRDRLRTYVLHEQEDDDGISFVAVGHS